MKKQTRTHMAFKNASITMICQIIYIVVSFVCRTVFTKVLGAEYLGLNGLFTNILTMLSFVELGIGSAIVYKMYKPLESYDKKMICIYAHFYKKIYTIIGLVVAVLGLGVLPFLKYIVDAPNIEINIHLLYLLFLTDTVISYFYVYKKSILIADQKNYIVAIYTQIFNVIMNVGQIIILLLTHNFILYLLFKILCDWLTNVACSIRTEKEYPFINDKVDGNVSKKDKNELIQSVKGLLLGKVASVAFDGTDNIFISMFSGVSTVGIISNYTLILTTLNNLFNQVFFALTSSIGHLGVNSDKSKVESVLKKLYFLNALLYGYLFVGMALLLRMFVMDIWIGSKYNLSFITVLFILSELVLRGIHYPVYMTRTAMGLFHQMKYIPPICAVINISLDFVLGMNYGVSGIFLATIVSRLITRATDIFVLYNYTFNKSSISYYLNHLKTLLFIIICTIISNVFIQFCNVLSMPVFLRFVLNIIIITIVFWGLVFIFYKNTQEYQYYFALINKKITGKIK